VLKTSKQGERPYIIALALILVLNAVLKRRFFCGLVEADDFSYAVYSFSMFRIPMSWDMSMDFRVLRLALLLPVAFLFRFLPPAEVVAVLYPMAVSFGSIVLVYLIGKKVYGHNAGILASFVLATFPADVIYSTILLPDGVVPFYLGLSVWAFLNAESGSGRGAKVWFAVSGFALFLAFVTRENSYYFLLFYLPFAFSARRWKKGLYMAAAGFAFPITVLYFIYYLKSGDFLFNLHLAEHYRDPLIESGYIPKNSENWYVILFFMFPAMFSSLIGRTVFISGLYGLTFYAGIFCVIYTAVKAVRRKNGLMFIAPWWFLVVYLYLEYGTISFTHYQMMKKLDRFLLTLTPAMALSYGVVLADSLGLGAGKVLTKNRIVERMRALTVNKRLMASFLLSCVVLAGTLYTSYGVMARQKADRDGNMRKFRWGYFSVLKKMPNRPVYNTGGWWNNKLSFYYLPDLRFAEMPWRRSGMLRDLKAVKDPSELAGSHVIIDRSHFSGRNDLRIKHSYDDFGGYVKVPPKDWVFLGREYDVEIYFVPDDWVYDEPDGKELALESLLYSVKIGDFALFVDSLHPDLLSRLSQKDFMELVRRLSNENDPSRDELLNKRIVYKKSEDRWKIDFRLD